MIYSKLLTACSCFDLQTLSVEGLRHPTQITTYIKQQKTMAFISAKGPGPEAALTGFCYSMDGLLYAAASCMNYINYAAVVTALAHIWAEAQRYDRFRSHADTREKLKALYQRCLQSLQQLLPDSDEQGCRTLLWSSATLGFNPDDMVPGMVHALTVRSLQLIDAEGKQRPNAQAAANVLWAFATMGHSAATSQVVETICVDFGRLTRQPDAQQRPTAQECSNLLWALAKMSHSSAAATEVVGTICVHFTSLTRQSDTKQRPKAQECANLLWALAQLKHAPLHDVVTALLDHLVAGVCQTPGLQPKSQHISNSLLACAELGLSVTSTCVKALLNHIFKILFHQQIPNITPTLLGV